MEFCSRAICTGKSRREDLADQERKLHKYQSVDQILTKVLELSVDKERAVAKTLRKTRGSLIGVYSPIHRIGRRSMRWNWRVAEKGPVLIENLEEYAGGEHYFSKEQDRSWDILYYSKQETGIWDFVSA